MDALRAWAHYGGVDGFRFDLATVLGRRDDGFDPAAPLITAIEQDPLLRELRLIAGAMGHRAGRLSGRRVPCVLARMERSVPRHDAQVLARRRRDGPAIPSRAFRARPTSSARAAAVPPLALTSSSPMMALRSRTSYLTIASTTRPTAKTIATEPTPITPGTTASKAQPTTTTFWKARRRDQRNLLATLLFARGTPMLAMGSEFGQSQRGNNNAYAQDNAMSWLDWERADGSLAHFTERAVARAKGSSRLHPRPFSHRRRRRRFAHPGRRMAYA